MHLTKSLQEQLNHINSIVKLAPIIDGSFPAEYAFIKSGVRRMRTEFADSRNDFSLILFERSDRQNYEQCYGRGVIKNIELLAHIIDLWVGKCLEINDIRDRYKELELYQDFLTVTHEHVIEEAWRKVKNMLFNDAWFWKNPNWEERNFELLNKAHENPGLKNYYPFLSHNRLCFSMDKDITETWGIGIYATTATDITSGKFYVSISIIPDNGTFFDNAAEAIDFYVSKLEERKPTKWI